MSEQIIFLKERFSFLLNHIELFLEDYNRLTTTYPNPVTESSEHFDFYLISNANRYIWEHFHIEANDFYVASNTSSLLNGLVKGKTYIIPPIFPKEQIEAFLLKLEHYRFAVGSDAGNDDTKKMERIYGELSDNQINLQLKVNGNIKLFTLEEVCQMVIRYRNFKVLDKKIKEQNFTSKIAMELEYLEQIIEEQLKIVI